MEQGEGGLISHGRGEAQDPHRGPVREALWSISLDRGLDGDATEDLRLFYRMIGFLTLISLHSFQTKRNRQFCADPRETWVQEYITDLELNA